MRRRHLNSTIGLVVCILLLLGSADAYDLRTHGSITEQGFGASQDVSRYLNEVGISLTDVFDRQAITRFDQLARFRNDGTVRGWMTEGAIREDDYQPHPFLETVFGCHPPRNPASLIDRPTHHFFDVQRDGAGLLTLVGGLPAPDWALGLQGRGPADNQNQFSLPDARVYQLRSLTESSRANWDRNTAKLFRTLGQVTHVLQDMAQPQHTRNDPHLGCDSSLLQFVAGETSWYEIYTETRALNEPYRTRSDASRPLVLSGYGPVRFQAYRDYWANPSGSGLADFSSRNFFSAGTNLGTFYFAGPCGGLQQPECDPKKYRTEDFDFEIPTLTEAPLKGRVRFLLRDIPDPLTGAVAENVRVSSRSLWDQHLETNQRQPKFSLNTYNHDSIADVLLPRAVGYSAGFLDYFFRGRLDVDLVNPDPSDPSLLQLVGTNASSDPLVDGTLTLYADDPAGNRSPVEAFGSVTLSNVLPGGPVASGSFQPPVDAERFVAVYQGTLGQELKDPSRNFPGGVIGKVLGGVRVEEVFSDGTRWNLRTSKGVFLLPLRMDAFEDVRWGDADNILVARSLFGVDQPNQVVAFEIQRRPGSVDPVTTDTADGPEVQIVQKSAVGFPLGLDLGTTVAISHVISYRQQIPTYQRTLVERWQPAFPGPEGDRFGEYRLVGIESTPIEIQTVSNQGFPFGERFPIVLDLAHFNAFRSDTVSYEWSMSEVGVDAAGHILGVVVVSLTFPPFGSQSVTTPFFVLNGQGDLEVGQFCSPFGGCSPLEFTLRRSYLGPNPLLWALVDLTAGRVLASTAESLITITSRETFEAPDWFVLGSTPPPVVYFHQFRHREGGPSPGTIDDGWGGSGLRFRGTEDFTVAGELTVQGGAFRGVLELTVTGSLRAALRKPLERAGLSTTIPDVGDGPVEFPFGSDQLALRVTRPPGGPFVLPARLMDARRARPAPGSERLVFVVAGGENDAVLAWDPGRPPGQVLLQQPAGAEEGLALGSVSRTTVLAHAPTNPTQAGGFLLPLDGSPNTRFIPDEDALFDFTLLDPSYLYNLSDLRFFRLQLPLQRTALPAKLADLPDGSNPIGDYHVIRIP